MIDIDLVGEFLVLAALVSITLLLLGLVIAFIWVIFVFVRWGIEEYQVYRRRK